MEYILTLIMMFSNFKPLDIVLQQPFIKFVLQQELKQAVFILKNPSGGGVVGLYFPVLSKSQNSQVWEFRTNLILPHKAKVASDGYWIDMKAFNEP